MLHQVRRSATLGVAAAAAAALGVTLLTAVGSAAAAIRPAGAAAAPASGASWGAMQEVPGTAALNLGGNADVRSLSCASAGNCTAAGLYTDGSAHGQAYVASEVSGTWQDAEELPGIAALNLGGEAAIESVSCASAGNCGAGGWYSDASHHDQAFVVSEVNGTWQNAAEAPGIAALGSRAFIDSVSCATAGNCSAGGWFLNATKHTDALVVSESHGIWQNAKEVPGTGTLNRGGGAVLQSVSCASPGNCSAAGYYTDSSRLRQLFVVSKTNGIWQKAQEVPGTAALNVGGDAEIASVSCASAGNCSAGGFYAANSPSHPQPEAFVVSEVNGTWQDAEEVPGTAALNTGNDANTLSVSCASAGNCSAGGYYAGAQGLEAFVVSEVNGTWQDAQEVPGTAALNVSNQARVASVSCASAGNCSAGGQYQDATGYQVFVVSEVNGTWRNAEEVPGSAALNTYPYAAIESVSCATPSSCSAGGWYIEKSTQHIQAFVVGRT